MDNHVMTIGEMFIKIINLPWWWVLVVLLILQFLNLVRIAQNATELWIMVIIYILPTGIPIAISIWWTEYGGSQWYTEVMG